MTSIRQKQDFDPEIVKIAQPIANQLISLEKEGYTSTLVPFKQRSNQVECAVHECVTEVVEMIARASQIIQARFQKEEQIPDADIPQEATLATWTSLFDVMYEKIHNRDPQVQKEVFSQPMQEYFSIPWPFMDRVFHLAGALFEEKEYGQAESVYAFLGTLQPAVFEYWYGKAVCQQAQNNLEMALMTYGISLALQPENPRIYYQMAYCLTLLDTPQAAVKALDMAISYAEKDPNQQEVLQQAKALKASLKSNMS